MLAAPAPVALVAAIHRYDAGSTEAQVVLECDLGTPCT